jgi:hypothetical protein
LDRIFIRHEKMTFMRKLALFKKLKARENNTNRLQGAVRA